jgi:hypothetical protein
MLFLMIFWCAEAKNEKKFVLIFLIARRQKCVDEKGFVFDYYFFYCTKAKMKRSLFLIIFHCTKAKTPFDELNLILRS